MSDDPPRCEHDVIYPEHNCLFCEIRRLEQELAAARAALLAVDNTLEFWKVEHPIRVLERIKAARAAGG